MFYFHIVSEPFKYQSCSKSFTGRDNPRRYITMVHESREINNNPTGRPPTTTKPYQLNSTSENYACQQTARSIQWTTCKRNDHKETTVPKSKRIQQPIQQTVLEPLEESPQGDNEHAELLNGLNTDLPILSPLETSPNILQEVMKELNWHRRQIKIRTYLINNLKRRV